MLEEIKVCMLKGTAFEGALLSIGDEIEVDATTAERWARFGIAEFVAGEPKDEPPKDEPPMDEPPMDEPKKEPVKKQEAK